MIILFLLNLTTIDSFSSPWRTKAATKRAYSPIRPFGKITLFIQDRTFHSTCTRRIWYARTKPHTFSFRNNQQQHTKNSRTHIRHFAPTIRNRIHIFQSFSTSDYENWAREPAKVCREPWATRKPSPNNDNRIRSAVLRILDTRRKVPTKDGNVPRPFWIMFWERL